jgi:sulfatase modifying factor 1
MLESIGRNSKRAHTKRTQVHIPRALAVVLGLLLLGSGLVAATWLVQRRTQNYTPSTESRGPYRPVMVVLPAGEFVMGSPEDEEGRDSSEDQHPVKLTRSFAIGRTEVTQGQWTALMGSNPSYFQGARAAGPDHPVERVNWFEALEYLNRLSASEGLEACYTLTDCAGTLGGGCLEGPPTADQGGSCRGDYECAGVKFRGLDCRGYRLPTEAEWEYVARATTVGAIFEGEWKVLGARNAPALGRLAWYGGNSGAEKGIECFNRPEMEKPELQRCGTQAVAGKRANIWGLHDLQGNVWEWTQDVWSKEPLGGTDPLRQEGAEQVGTRRGCSWKDDAHACRVSFRDGIEPKARSYGTGFRPARSFP